MLISEFARVTALSPDTIRFYVRRGLLQPETSAKGGRNPYQLFSDDHVKAAQMIRLGQALGLSLKEIAGLLDEHRHGRITRERTIALMSAQRDRLRRKAAELLALSSYLDAKLAWMEDESAGPEPRMEDHVAAVS